MDGTTGATAAAAAAGGSGISAEEEKARLAFISHYLETRDALRMYNWLSQRCFADCVSTFYRKALGKGEGDCVRACVRKYQLVKSATGEHFRELADPSAAASSFDDDEDDE